LAIGFAVFLGHTVLLPVDGCSINPARSLGPAIVSGNWAGIWIFIIAPLIGSFLGVFVWLMTSKNWDRDNAVKALAPRGAPVEEVTPDIKLTGPVETV
jgi:hypothetical protein